MRSADMGDETTNDRSWLFFAILFVAYWYFMTARILPEIPHSKLSSLHPLGDLPALVWHFKKFRKVFDFLAAHCVDLGSPITQLLLGGSAFVVVGDLRETHDVALRRNREFRHADRQDKTFKVIAKNATISMQSHAAFWAQRRLWTKIMTTPFLHQVAAPRLWNVCESLTHLWHRKSILGGERFAFDAVGDIHDMLMDAMWAILVGKPMGIISGQIKHLDTPGVVHRPDSQEEPVRFPTGVPPPIARACRKLISCADPLLMSPAPDFQRWLTTLTPSFRKAQKLKVKTMTSLIKGSREKYVPQKQRTGTQIEPECAIDYVLWQASQMNLTEEQCLAVSDDHLQDEMFMFLVAGLNSTSLALTWGLKFLSDNPHCQKRLRREVFASFQGTDRAALPPAELILGKSIPYLEATIWETLRMSHPAPAIIRQARRDTVLLGRRIPQDTVVMFTLEGESLVNDRPLKVPEEWRSSTSQAARTKWPRPWTIEGKKCFAPERWLRQVDVGVEIFDPAAGPSLPFSAGARSCYGQKLVRVLMRLFFVSMVWSCEFDKVPEDLATYEIDEVLTRSPKHGFLKVRPTDESS